MKKSPYLCSSLAGIGGVLACAAAQAITFTTDDLRGSFDSTISTGAGIRTQTQSQSLVSPIYDPTFSTIVGGGRLGQASGINDQGDLNYDRGDFFTGYLKGSHELLLKMPSQGLTFMARANWIRDFAATETTGTRSGQALLAEAFTGAGPAIGADGLSEEARKEMRFKARLLDLWVSKTFSLGDQEGRVRVGNQVVSWGESLFEGGGINATNAYDVNRLSQPGTQLKEAVLPAPMVSVASGLGNGVNVEAYVQARWNRSYLPPVGSYWSTSSSGVGGKAYGTTEEHARNSGQWGLAMRYQPKGAQLNLGLYAMTYHDKVPQVTIDLATGQAGPLKYLEDRHMLGVSANFPVGDWAIGTELSYRPNDAVSLNAASGCVAQGGNCWVEEKRFQWHLTTLLALQPGNADTFLKLLGADTAQLVTETVVISYPNLKRSYGGSPLAAGGWLWGNESLDLVQSGGVINSPGSSAGTKTSAGIDIDFSWTYDGTLLPGWQVSPEIFFRRGLTGRTPNVTSQFMKGVTSVNYLVNFIQNPANWQFTFNYARFIGGDSPLDNPVRDRDFVGLALSRNF